ncbi:SCAN domain-containing protein 3-like [Parasteatoda tepidariorum]|uniref:SCAN domain-containing protein 3-like n=1 Tax=Parasteatoda tepidariorum TaxID=114398 RepID=UPI0039BC6098
MDKFLIGYKRKSTNNEDSEVGTSSGNTSHKEQEGRTPKTRKYDLSYLSFGFTNIINDNVEKPMCLLCSKVLAADSMRPGKLKRHLVTIHSEYVASYLVSYRIAQCKKPHTIAETLVLPAAIDMVKKMFGQSYANQLRQIPLADNTIGRRIDDISENLCDQLVSRMRTSKFAIQVDEATDVVKDAHLIAYVRYVDDTNIIEDILFCRPIPDRATSNEIFKIIGRFFNETDVVCNNCIGLCTDGAQSMAGHKTCLQTPVKMKTPEVLWTHCMLHRAALVSKTISEELNNLFAKVTKVINYIKNSPLKARLFAKLCEDMRANYTSLLYYCEVRWLSRAKMIQRILELCHVSRGKS